ncbi:MAG: hypothetical protein ACLQPH_04370 [Acidimicrobiales bacterium]
MGAVALMGGFMGAAIGVSALTATAAGAVTPPGAYSCTVTDTNTGNHVTATGLIYPATQPVGTISGATPGDTINFNCTGLGANESVAVVQASGLAAYDNPANEESYADLSHANLAGSANASGDYNQNLNSLYTNGDTNVTAPPSLVAENLGSQSNLVTAADEGTQDPLILVNLAFTGGVSPTPTNINLGANYVVNANTSTTPLTAAQLGTTGYWWGAGEEGTGGTSPIPNPSVLIDGATPIASAGTAGTGSSTLTVSAGSYALGAPGTPTYPVLGGGIVLPEGLAPGVHSLTVAEGTLEAGSLTATTTFYVPGGTGTGGTGPSGNVGPNTSATFSGSTGWAPVTSTFSGVWVPPAGCTVGNQPATSLGAVGSGGTETFTVNTSDLSSAIFNNTLCVPGSWTIDVTQKVGATTVATAVLGPLSVVDLTATCNIASVGSCLVQQGIGQQVNGTDLTVTEYAATSGIGAPGQNPSAILVNLSPVTLGPGVFQAGQGELNTVEVNDSRGTLSGWTVTGILESDFIGPNVGNDNTIPADYLTWNPSVSLTYPGNLAAGVVPSGTVSPPVYGPDACAAGSAATGTNSNIKCPTVNDNAGSNNPSGNAATGQVGGSTPPSNHAGDPNWPSTGAEGPSGLLYEVQAGPIANLGTSDSGAADFGSQPAQVLCEAPSGGGGGAFNCDASLSLAVPPYVAAGHYTATMDLLTTAT